MSLNGKCLKCLISFVQQPLSWMDPRVGSFEWQLLYFPDKSPRYSTSQSAVLQQWKQASIRPVPKVAVPTQQVDFRPISITPILTRIMEQTVVQSYLYPAFLSPPPSLSFSDQFAFRSTGSPTAAIIYLLHTINDIRHATI